MTELKRILGIILIGIALLFVCRIPMNYRSTDAKAPGKLGADVALSFIFGASGGVLINGSRKTG